VAVSEQSVGHTLDVRDRVNAQYAEAGKRIAQMRRLEAQKRRMLHKAELAKELERVNGRPVARQQVYTIVREAVEAGYLPGNPFPAMDQMRRDRR